MEIRLHWFLLGLSNKLATDDLKLKLFFFIINKKNCIGVLGANYLHIAYVKRCRCKINGSKW